SQSAKGPSARTSIGGGVYRSEDGRYWARPWINRRRTWRLLKAETQRAAFKEASNATWNTAAESFTQLAALYTAAGCPNKRLERRPPAFCEPEEKRIAMLAKFFGITPAAVIRLVNLPAYAKWRIRQCGRGTKQRAVDKDTQTLSNILNYGVAI